MDNPVEAITTVYNYPYKKVTIVEGAIPGQKKIVETFYNVTVYDKNGTLQEVTNSHQVSYLV